VPPAASITHAQNPAPPPVESRPAGTPLWSVYFFTFLSSIGTGVVTSGIYFLTRGSYHFSQVQNYALGVVMGLMYIAGAALAGPLTGWLRRCFPALTTRAILSGITGLMGAVCALPILIPGSWVVWLTVVVYNPLSGALWPIVESYVSGGRPGPTLRAALSRWNVVWSSSLVFAYWGLSPLIERHGALAILLLGLIHLSSLGLLPHFGREPGAHGDGHHEPHPDSYPRLLTVFRLLLPTAFMVVSALSPYLPAAMARLGVPGAWAPALATAWLLPRAIAFLGLDRWQRWHGSWAMPVVGGLFLLGGFAMSVLAPLGLPAQAPDGPHPARLAVLLGGLGLFGIGVATIYAGAVYYAMEVGRAEVDAGGTHEALIGVGYTVGPFVGLLATLAAQKGLIAPGNLEWGVLAPVAALALLVGTIALTRAWHGKARGDR
jgi:hypothetical protein